MSTEYRYDDETTIRVTLGSWGDLYNAVEVRNGYTIGTIADAPTADEAHAKAVRYLQQREQNEAAAESLTATGIYADLTTGPRTGIHATLQAIAPSPAAAGECSTCGLNEATCDCR
jgi:hypothetical protein